MTIMTALGEHPTSPAYWLVHSCAPPKSSTNLMLLHVNPTSAKPPHYASGRRELQTGELAVSCDYCGASQISISRSIIF